MIEVKNVSKKYGNFYAVRNINFDIRDGEIVGFLGRNGAGKTTTMNMLTGFIEPSQGEIIINGYDVDVKPKKVKKLIGYMPEGTPLYYELTVKEFVTYMADLKLIPRNKKKAAIEKAIMEAGLDKVRNRLTKNLSRGFKQRVSLAGALVGDPEILILDEPTVGLDPKQVKEIRELIKSLKGKHTVILSSHILSEVSQICEKVIIIDKGEIIAIDTPENLEKQTETESIIHITVDDPENKFEEVITKIEEVEVFKFINNKDAEIITKLDDNKYTKTENELKNYELKLKENLNDVDLRKKIATKCAQNNILVIELKKEERSLEDAFIKLVENRPEYSYKEIKQMQYEKELEELRKEYEEKKANKEKKKQAKQETKEGRAKEKKGGNK